MNFVDTVTIAGPSAMALPAVTAAMAGRSITVCDATGGAGANVITITPNGTDTIDGVNAPVSIVTNYGFIKLQGVAVGKWKVISSNARVVAGTSDGLMTAVQATNLAAIADDHVTARCIGLDLKVDEQNVPAVLSGVVGKTFVPTHIVLKVVTNVGALNADGTVNVGTAADGTQIASALALTGLTAVGATRVVPLAANTSAVLGNATLHANVETAETGAGTLALDVYVIGRQV
jgi:hypothetical protein